MLETQPQFRLKQTVSIKGVVGTVVDFYSLTDEVRMYIVRTQFAFKTQNTTTKVVHVPEGVLEDTRTPDEIVLDSLTFLEDKAQGKFADVARVIERDNEASPKKAMNEVEFYCTLEPAFEARATLDLIDSICALHKNDDEGTALILLVERVVADFLLDRKLDIAPPVPMGISYHLRNTYLESVARARTLLYDEATRWPGFDAKRVEDEVARRAIGR